MENNKPRWLELSLLTFAISTLITMHAAHATDTPVQCDTLAACKSLKTQIDTKLSAISFSVPSRFTDAARDEVGQVLHLKSWDAEDYCGSLGLRLPNARELAYYARSFGADVRETPANGYERVQTSRDSFYYSSLGYKRPVDDRGTHWFWSQEGMKRDGIFPVTAFGGGNGQFFLEDGPSALDFPGMANGAVVCIQDESAPSTPHPPAANQCDSLNSCLALSARVEARVITLQGGLPKLTSDPQNADGSLRVFNHNEAVSYCASQGLRLPAIKELAQYAQGAGSRVSDTPVAGYEQIMDFYYSAVGYLTPPAGADGLSLWSSTFDASYSTMAYQLESDGSIVRAYTNPDHVFDEHSTARCIGVR